MVEKVIIDKNVIKSITNRNDRCLVIQYNLKSKRAFFKTENMVKRKPIELSRVIEL